MGNITRPPYRSVSAPTGMRPIEPTTTGTATISATSDSESRPRLPFCRKSGPRGLISAHAQKLTANPTVAVTSMADGDRETVDCGTATTFGWLVVDTGPSKTYPTSGYTS